MGDLDMNVEDVKISCENIIAEIGKFFVGHADILRRIMAAALANGHVLFEDYPGLGKTMLAKSFARAMGCSWQRIQFTPDLMPADIIGTKIWKTNITDFELERGPIFTHVLLADEINRAPPKVQSALLECMGERQVTIEGETHVLEPPFFVMGTQNPIDLEGTYSLPEGQLDRFLLKLSIGYIKRLDEEVEILMRRSDWKKDDPTDLISEVSTDKRFRQLQEVIEHEVLVSDDMLTYITQIVRRTRESPYIEVGASPRGSLSFFKIAKANAALDGRDYVIPDDVKFYAQDILKHRLILKREYSMDERITVESIIDGILQEVKVPIQDESG